VLTKVPFLDLLSTYTELKGECDEASLRVLGGGWYIMGRELEAFEAEFAQYCGTTHCLGVANGLDALKMALLALGVGRGDEVIVPANTFIATWLAVSDVGAIPVAVDVDPQDLQMSAAGFEAAITPKTRAVIPVHLYGHMGDLPALVQVARKHGIKVIEDAAQAHGSAVDGKRAGAFGDCAAFSFYPGKNLGAFGDGGAICTNDREVFERIQKLRNYGSSKKYHHDLKGFNSRLDEFQAAFLRVKLKHLDEWNLRRQRLADLYSKAFAGNPVIRCVKLRPGVQSSWHLFTVQVPRRDEVQAELAKRGIQTLIHYPIPCHLAKAYEDLGYRQGSFPVTEESAATLLSLPIGPHLSEADARVVAAALQETVGSLAR